MTPGIASAVRALRDCGVIRSHWQHASLDQARRAGLAAITVVPNRIGIVDFRLTDAGWDAASTLEPSP